MAIGAKEVLNHVIPEIRDDMVWHEFLNALFENSQGELDAYALYNWIGTLPEQVPGKKGKYVTLSASDVPFLFKGGSLYNVESACAIEGQALKSSSAVKVSLPVPTNLGTISDPDSAGVTTFDTLLDFSLLPLDIQSYLISEDNSLYLELEIADLYVTLGGTDTCTLQYEVDASNAWVTYTNPFSVESGSTIRVKATAKTGYTFTRWSDGETTAQHSDITVSNDVNLSAIATINYHTLTLPTVTNGTIKLYVNGAETTATSVPYNSAVELRVTPSLHYQTTAGMWTGKFPSGLTPTITSNGAIVKFNMPDSNVTIGAISCPVIQWTLTLQGSNCTLSGAGTYNEGTSVSVSCTPDTGYNFTSWSDGGAATHNVTVNSNMTLTATTTIKSYTVAASSSTGTITGTGTYTHGQTCTLRFTPSSHYHVTSATWDNVPSGWTVSSDYKSITGTVTSTISGVTATATIDQHTLTLSGTNCTVTGAGTYNYGSTANVGCTPNSHYHFTSWSDSGAQSHTVSMTQNRSLTATCSIDTQRISKGTFTACSFVSAKMGDTPSTCTTSISLPYDAPYGKYVQLTLSPSSQYEATSSTWSGLPAGTTYSSDYTVATFQVGTADITAAATCILKKYKVTATADAHSTVKILVGGTEVPSGSMVNANSSVTITCTPSEHYNFLRWSNGSTANPYTISTLTSAISVSATTDVKSYTITTSATNGTVTGGGTYPYGSTVTLTVSPVSDVYQFVRWSDSSTSNPRTITVTGNATYSAICSVIQYNVKAAINRAAAGTLRVTADGVDITAAATSASGATCDKRSRIEFYTTPSDTNRYPFTSWSDGETTTSHSAITLLNNVSLTANYGIRYLLTLVATGPGIASYDVGPWVTAGAQVRLVALPNTGATFQSWSDGGAASHYIIMPAADSTYTAYFGTQTRSIRMNTVLNDNAYTWGDKVSCSSGNKTAGGSGYNYATWAIGYGNQTSMVASEVSGYTFLGWYSGTTRITTSYTYVLNNVTADATYTAKWVSETQSVTFDSATYMQLGNKKYFGFNIANSTSALYNTQITVHVWKRVSGSADSEICSSTYTLSSTGTASQSTAGSALYVTDTSTTATYYATVTDSNGNSISTGSDVWFVGDESTRSSSE